MCLSCSFLFPQSTQFQAILALFAICPFQVGCTGMHVSSMPSSNINSTSLRISTRYHCSFHTVPGTSRKNPRKKEPVFHLLRSESLRPYAATPIPAFQPSPGHGPHQRPRAPPRARPRDWAGLGEEPARGQCQVDRYDKYNEK